MTSVTPINPTPSSTGSDTSRATHSYETSFSSVPPIFKDLLVMGTEPVTTQGKYLLMFELFQTLLEIKKWNRSIKFLEFQAKIKDLEAAALQDLEAARQTRDAALWQAVTQIVAGFVSLAGGLAGAGSLSGGFAKMKAYFKSKDFFSSGKSGNKPPSPSNTGNNPSSANNGGNNASSNAAGNKAPPNASGNKAPPNAAGNNASGPDKASSSLTASDKAQLYMQISSGVSKLIEAIGGIGKAEEDLVAALETFQGKLHDLAAKAHQRREEDADETLNALKEEMQTILDLLKEMMGATYDTNMGILRA